MPTSRKRTKKRRQRRFLGAILGICLVAGVIAAAAAIVHGLRKNASASASSLPQASAEPAETPVSLNLPSSADYSGWFGHKVKADFTALYVLEGDTFVKAGTAEKDAVFDIGDTQNGDYIPIRDSIFWVNGAEVSGSDRWYRNDTNLLPWPEKLITADSYHIYDAAGTLIATVNRSDTWPLYVKAGKDGMYGIRFMNGISFIPQQEVKETVSTGEAAPQSAAEIPVLMYHFFYSSADGGSRVDGNYVEVNELDEHLNYIHENNKAALTMREVLWWMEQRAIVPPGSLAITIDDADPSVHQYAMPVFAKYGIHATNFVICGWQPSEMPYELWEMRENGMELQSHGFLTHTGGCSGMGHGGILMCMDHDAGVQDTIQSFDYVDGGFVYCYPFGDINENAESIVRDGGAELAFTTESGWIHPGMDPLALPRVRVTGGSGLSAYAASIG